MKSTLVNILIIISLLISCKKNNTGAIEEKYNGYYTYTNTVIGASGYHTTSGSKYQTVSIRHLVSAIEESGDQAMFTYYSIDHEDSIKFYFERSNDDSVIYKSTTQWGGASLVKFPTTKHLIFTFSESYPGGSKEETFSGDKQ